VLELERREKEDLIKQLEVTSARLKSFEDIRPSLNSRNVINGLITGQTNADTIDNLYIAELEDVRDRLSLENKQIM